MAEQNPIKYSDLISPDDSIEKLIAQLEELQTVYNGVVSSVRSQAAAMAASLRSVSGATEEGRDATRGASKEADRLTKAYKDLAFARSETARQIAELKQQQKEEQMITKLNVQLNNAAEGSYNRLSAQYRLNKIALNNLTEEERKTLPYAKKLEEETLKIYEQMKRLQEATGKFSLNVGNYEQSITNAIGINTKWYKGLQEIGALFEGGFANGVKQAGSAVSAFGKKLLALLANPIVATIAVITAAFMALAKGISTSEENTNRLERILAPFQRILTAIVSVLQTMAEGLLKGVEGMENLAMGASRLMERLPLVGKAFKQVNDALAENIELTKEKQFLEKAERSKGTANAKLSRDVAMYKHLAATTEDATKKKHYLNMAIASENKIMENELKLAYRDLALKQKLAQQSQNDAKTNEELEKAKQRVYKAEEDNYNHKLKMEKQLMNLNRKSSGGGGGGKSTNDDLKRQMQEEERLRKEKEKRELQAIRRAQDAQANLLENEYDRRYLLTELQYDRQIEDLKAQMKELGEDEVTAKQAYDAEIIALEELKWKKLADIRDKQMQDALDAEQKDYEKRIKATDELIKKQQQDKKKNKDIYDLMGFKLDDEQKRAIDESLNYALESVYTFMDAYVAAAEKKKQLADTEVERTRNVLEVELQARANGYANEVETARKEFELAKKNQQKALKEQQRAQRAQEALDTAAQVSSLITATANIWKAMTSMGPWGVAAAIAATALMFGSFAAAKIQALNAAGSSTEEYGEGTVELLQGGSHQSGNDIDLGRKKDGTRRRAEGGEYFAIINKRNSRKYRDLIPEVVNSLNDGTFAEKYMGAYGGDVNVSVQGRNDHLRALSDDVHQIRQQGEMRTYTDARGNTVTSYKNVKRIIKAS